MSNKKKLFILIILLIGNFFNCQKYLLKYIQINKSELTLEEKIGQLFIIGVRGEYLTDDIRELIRKYKLGNFIIFSPNCKNIKQLEKLTRQIHKEVIRETGIMPFISIDQEGGNTVRIKDETTFYPGHMTISATNVENAKIIGHMMGQHLISLGINMNFAPLLDINNNPKNPIIGIRSFSDRPEIVSQYGIEMIKGMQEEGIIATAKHFPGHGDTEIDSHLGLPVVPFDTKRLYNMELRPFKDAIEKGVSNIMTAHIIFTKVDPENPATISKKILKDILRKDLNYSGLVTSDSMKMKAISEGITTPLGVAKGIKAGLDLVIVSSNSSLIINSVKKLTKDIKDNIISMEEIDEKIKRILNYKNIVYSSMKTKFFKNKNNLNIFKNDSLSKTIQDIVDSSLTHVSGKKLELKGKILLYGCITSPVNRQDDIKNETIITLINKELPTFNTLEFRLGEYSQELIKKAAGYDTVIFIAFNAFTDKSQSKMINEINKISSNFYVISIRTPYDYLVLDKNINYYTMYECTPNSMKTIVKFLKGEIEAKGKLPIKLQK